MPRKSIPVGTQRAVLIECGYRCATPTCGQILTLDIHHLDYVCEGGSNDPENLIALCPNCHRLHHSGVIPTDALRVWKGVLVARNAPYNIESFDLLRYLDKMGRVVLSPDGTLRLAALIAEGLVSARLEFDGPSNMRHRQPGYVVSLTERGAATLRAWVQGNTSSLSGPPPEEG